jgi:hypothetical protein
MDDDKRMHLDDEQMSLQSKIAGGGRDLGEEAGDESLRLCPGCGRVTTFVQGKCSNCDYKPGRAAGIEEAAMIRMQSEGVGGGGGAMRGLLVVLVIIALGVIGYFVFTGVKHKNKDDESTPASAQKADTSASDASAVNNAKPPATHAGGLNPVTIDEAFNDSLKQAITAADQALKDAGKDCFIYRYRATDNLVPATSQTVSITLFCGGKDAAQCVANPGDQTIRTAMQKFTDDLAQHEGVISSLNLNATEGKEAPDPKDTYLRYGYYFGIEHMDRIQAVIDGIEAYKSEGSGYPSMIASSMSNTPFQTEGGLSFVAGGFGYLPLYEADASGNIIMGSGSGVASYEPKSVTGYYLVMYAIKETMGLDMYSDEDYRYYQDRILPFPYEPKSPVHNMQLHPDGKPDGIACIVKNGKLQE